MNENELIQSLKIDFDNIEIPDDLFSKVQDAISEAKSKNAETVISKTSGSASGRETEGTSTIKKQNRRKYGFLAAAAALALFIILPNTSATVCHAMEKIPVLGEIVKVITIREYKDDKGNVSADIKTPEVQPSISVDGQDTANDSTANSATAATNENSSVSELNGEIQKYTDEIIAQYESDAKLQGDTGHENVTTDYTVVTDNDRLFALRFDTTVTMADSGQTVKIYNVDKSTGKILSLSDMFDGNADYVTALKKDILDQMKENNKIDENNIYFAQDPNMAGEINMDDEIKKANFYVNKDGALTIVFDKGTVAPMYMGVLEFTIEEDTLKNLGFRY